MTSDIIIINLLFASFLILGLWGFVGGIYLIRLKEGDLDKKWKLVRWLVPGPVKIVDDFDFYKGTGVYRIIMSLPLLLFIGSAVIQKFGIPGSQTVLIVVLAYFFILGLLLTFVAPISKLLSKTVLGRIYYDDLTGTTAERYLRYYIGPFLIIFLGLALALMIFD